MAVLEKLPEGTRNNAKAYIAQNPLVARAGAYAAVIGLALVSLRAAIFRSTYLNVSKDVCVEGCNHLSHHDPSEKPPVDPSEKRPGKEGN